MQLIIALLITIIVIMFFIIMNLSKRVAVECVEEEEDVEPEDRRTHQVMDEDEGILIVDDCDKCPECGGLMVYSHNNKNPHAKTELMYCLACKKDTCAVRI